MSTMSCITEARSSRSKWDSTRCFVTVLATPVFGYKILEFVKTYIKDMTGEFFLILPTHITELSFRYLIFFVLGLLIFDVFNEIFLRALLIFDDIGERREGRVNNCEETAYIILERPQKKQHIPFECRPSNCLDSKLPSQRSSSGVIPRIKNSQTRQPGAQIPQPGPLDTGP